MYAARDINRRLQSCGRSRNDNALSIVFNCTTSFLARGAILRIVSRGEMKPVSTRNIALCHAVRGQKNAVALHARHARVYSISFISLRIRVLLNVCPVSSVDDFKIS